MKIQKKYIYAGLIGLVTITGATLYLQYQKLMNYTIGLKKVKINKLTPTGFDIDLFLNFENKSNLKFTIEKQKYEVYINDVFLTTMRNDKPNVILPKSVSVLGMNLKESNKEVADKLKKLVVAIATNDKTMVKIVTTMSVKFGFITLSFPPYPYQDTLKNLMA
jgi:LEA14-like dessication related protein